MSQPLSEIPEPGFARRSRRRSQSDLMREVLQAAKAQTLRSSQNLWRRGKRHPRSAALIGGAVALTLVGAYTLSATGVGRSLCPPIGESSASSTKTQKTPRFLLLMDPIPYPAAGSELEIRYDVCGLPSGTAYRGQLRLAPQQAVRKGSARPKPLVVSFQGKVDGPATRRSQELDLGSTKPGSYMLELSVLDNQGRGRKRLQKVVVQAR